MVALVQRLPHSEDSPQTMRLSIHKAAVKILIISSIQMARSGLKMAPLGSPCTTQEAPRLPVRPLNNIPARAEIEMI